MSMSSPKLSPTAMPAQFGTYPSRAKTVGAATMVWIVLLFFKNEDDACSIHLARLGHLARFFQHRFKPSLHYCWGHDPAI
jgi:hypothetical protein